MHESTNKHTFPESREFSTRLISQPIRRSFQRVLKSLQYGTVELVWPDGKRTTHGAESDSNAGPRVTVTLHNYIAIRRLVLGGHNGFAEAYFEGHWSTTDLRAMFEIVMRNEQALKPVLAGKLLARVRDSLMHLNNRNSRAGSRRNIAFHYDLGNDFYSVWLDQSMTYSSALYDSENHSLSTAQQNKIDRISSLLSPTQDSRVLEIGCGWGALGAALVEQTDCHVHGVSLSREQLDYARRTHTDSKLKFEFQDYREINGKYDHIVSIEMFEAVGMAYWKTYFDQLGKLLKSKGTVLLQTITIEEDRFDSYRRNPDFIQRYVFPGGMLPTKEKLDELVSEAGFEIRQSEWFGKSYARTLAAWRDNFERRLSCIRELGYDEKFIRLWRYYLTYCETGFDRGTTDVGMLLLARRDGQPA
ncbi:MAG: cyclopropane-fatty-acyl-phospholipid synthase family protein [Gammaproteobacteria bacterium]|nr:cyclopropane-fatty-acyl-phospholipid synthase family protein [Gammaproteobacteria bacterium]